MIIILEKIGAITISNKRDIANGRKIVQSLVIFIAVNSGIWPKIKYHIPQKTANAPDETIAHLTNSFFFLFQSIFSSFLKLYCKVQLF